MEAMVITVPDLRLPSRDIIPKRPVPPLERALEVINKDKLNGLEAVFMENLDGLQVVDKDKVNGLEAVDKDNLKGLETVDKDKLNGLEAVDKNKLIGVEAIHEDKLIPVTIPKAVRNVDPEAQQHVLIVNGGKIGQPPPTWEDPQDHWHYSHRSPWLRALILGANDGLVSISALMLGIGAVKDDLKAMAISGLAGLIAGATSMAIGEFVSVFSQRDTELADLEKERQEHAKGPEAEARELEELTQIYVGRGLTYFLAKQVAEELSKGDVLKAHARDELGIDIDALSNPLQASIVSAIAFLLGGCLPLLAGAFVTSYKIRIGIVVLVASIALATFGAIGARLGGAPMTRAAIRLLLGGWTAMVFSFGILRLLSSRGL